MPGTSKRTWRGAVAAIASGVVVVGVLVAGPATSPAQDEGTVDLDTVFRCVNTDQAVCDEGRDLVLTQCTTCHTYGPIVLQQFDEGGWRGLLDRHRVQADTLTGEQFETLQAYLAANFNPDMDPPEVPDYILKAWTDY